MLKPVYALIGTDLFLQVQHLAELASAAQDAQRVDLDGQDAELSAVLDELRTFSMFSAAKLVVVRDADQFISTHREALERYVAEPSSSGTLVLRCETLPANQRIYKLIAKVGQVLDCKPPKDLVGWLQQRARKAHALEVPRDAAQMLAELIGGDLGRLDNELAKLALSSEGGRVTAAAIGKTVVFQREQEMWDMTNELAAGRPEQAVRRWRQLVQLDSSAEFRAVVWLGIWLERVRKALALRRQGMSPDAVASTLKIWPRDLVGPFIATAERIGESGAARLLDDLAQIDFQSKTGVGDMTENVERFLLTVAARRMNAPQRHST